MDSPSAKTRAPVLGQPRVAGDHGDAGHAGDGGEGDVPPARGSGSREMFCRFLRAERDRAALTIGDIARVTRIPEHSLRRLEAGQFEDLPADVFVRGFLRSYARCVGADADEVVRRYDECGPLARAPVASDVARVAAEEAAAAAELEDRGDIVTPRREVVAPRPPAAEKLARWEPTASAGDTLLGWAAGSAWRPGPEPPAEARSRSTTASDPGAEASGEAAAARGSRTAESARLTASLHSRRRRERHARRRAPSSGGVRGPTATRAPERRGPAGPRERRSFAEPRRAATSSSWIAQAERRGPLALAIAVGILVIAALVTMSYLLRGP